MRILMLGRWLPPPRRPVRGTREYQIARHLARRHQLTLAFVADHGDSAGPIAALRGEFGDLEFSTVPRGWKSLASAVRLAAGESCTMSYFRSEALRTRLAERLSRTAYGLVFVSSSSMIQYALGLSPSIPLVMDFAQVDSEWWARQATRGSFPAARFFRTEAARLRAAETAAARRAALCLTETPDAAEIVRSLGPAAPVGVVPSSVDVHPRGADPRVAQPPTVVLGTLFRDGDELKDALDLCRALVPAVRAEVPRARFVIASRDSIPGGRSVMEGLGVEVLTAVDPRPLFHGRAVAVAMPGAGFDLRASVLEPMAAGVAVVTTGPVCERLGACVGREMQAADRVPDMAQRVIELLENSARREEIGAHGRAFVEANFSRDVVMGRLDQHLAAVVGAEPASEPAPTPLPTAVVRGA
jgi:glycosyltransferase involved in cell wall biosynthesis